jgi:hypothetical protein
MILHLTRSSRSWTLPLQGLEVFQFNSTVSIEIHKDAIFDRLKIKRFSHQKTICDNLRTHKKFSFNLLCSFYYFCDGTDKYVNRNTYIENVKKFFNTST